MHTRHSGVAAHASLLLKTCDMERRNAAGHHARAKQLQRSHGHKTHRVDVRRCFPLHQDALYVMASLRQSGAPRPPAVQSKVCSCGPPRDCVSTRVVASPDSVRPATRCSGPEGARTCSTLGVKRTQCTARSNAQRTGASVRRVCVQCKARASGTTCASRSWNGAGSLSRSRAVFALIALPTFALPSFALPSFALRGRIPGKWRSTAIGQWAQGIRRDRRARTRPQRARRARRAESIALG